MIIEDLRMVSNQRLADDRKVDGQDALDAGEAQ
jgi:hypothetical protein